MNKLLSELELRESFKELYGHYAVARTCFLILPLQLRNWGWVETAGVRNPPIPRALGLPVQSGPSVFFILHFPALFFSFYTPHPHPFLWKRHLWWRNGSSPHHKMAMSERIFR
ncbi:hypothetical protein CEXT_739811 [Caerostris extrusa]|uniref:Uncharacterized protein n=1 Tax=Caerostris extrusa TaxID=172846 RepID=A0AAV4U8G3_CAEEX|nr:hypothetical protein CEXT_739811 [Caerostris extrusa]